MPCFNLCTFEVCQWGDSSGFRELKLSWKQYVCKAMAPGFSYDMIPAD